MKALNSNNETPLHIAVNLGHEDIVRTLVGLGADITHKCPYARSYMKGGEASLHVAAYNGNLEMVKTLIALGADITQECNYDGKVMNAEKLDFSTWLFQGS